MTNNDNANNMPPPLPSPLLSSPPPTAPSVTIIGAGIIGVTSAWQLARRGWRVLLLERRESVALETSFANGGQISPSEVAPWSKPETVRLALSWMLRSGAPFRWRPAADPAQWRWLWGFLSRCTNRANAEGLRQLFPLAQASVAELRRSREVAHKEGWALEYNATQRGILHIFRTARALDKERESHAPLQEWGIELQSLSQDECIELEPSLRFAPENLRGGGLFTPDDESGDAHLFARALWENAKSLGVQTRFNTEVETLQHSNDGRVLPVVEGEALQCDLVLLCAACDSRELARAIDISLPLWPIKGYSLTADIADESHAPKVSITDRERRTVFTRLGARMRAAGLAEIARSTNEELDPNRARVLVHNLESLFPGCVDLGSIRFWRGYRPMMWDSIPLIGKAPACENLWFNLGHGSLGWSLGMGSAALLAQLMDGETPIIPPHPYDPSLRLSRRNGHGSEKFTASKHRSPDSEDSAHG